MPDQTDGPPTVQVVEQNVPFDRYELDELVREIGGYLAELRHIDMVMEWLGNRPPENRNPLGLPAPPNAFHEFGIPLGRTFPFILSFTLYNVDPSYVEGHMDYLALDAADWAEDRLAELYEVVRPIAFPLVSSHDSLIGEIETVMDALRHIKTDFGELNNNLGDWKGVAAENFADNFYTPFEDCLGNQRDLVEALHGALRVSRGIVTYSQQSLMNAVSNTHAALRDQLLQRSHGGQTPSVKAFLSVASTITGIVSLILSPVPGASIPLAAASSGLAVAAEVLPDPPATLKIEGTSAAALEESTSIAIGEIKTFVDSSYTELYQELAALRTWVDRTRDNGVLLPGRPDLADGVAGDDFHHATSSRHAR